MENVFGKRITPPLPGRMSREPWLRSCARRRPTADLLNARDSHLRSISISMPMGPLPRARTEMPIGLWVNVYMGVWGVSASTEKRQRPREPLAPTGRRDFDLEWEAEAGAERKSKRAQRQRRGGTGANTATFIGATFLARWFGLLSYIFFSL